MTHSRRLKQCLPTLGFAFALILNTDVAQADTPYRLLSGDVVAMSVSGIPDLTQKATVQLDGSLSLPMVGDVRAAGRTLSEVREAIRTAIASRLVSVYTADGQEHFRTVTRDQVSAWIAEYRPVFVSGEVVRSGEFNYLPGMTVRQAIAAAGGVQVIQGTAFSANVAGLESDYTGAWYALATSDARVWRIRTELGENIAFNPSNLPPAKNGAAKLEDILSVQKELRAARDIDNERQRAFLKRAIDQITKQTSVLNRELDVQKKSEQADAADLKRAVELSGKGLFTDARLSDLRRAALTSATMRLQTESNLMQLERRSTEVARELERLDDNRRLALLDELQQAQARQASDGAKLNALADRIRAAGVSFPQAGAAEKIAVTVERSGVADPIQATPGMMLQPGDVVQVSPGPNAPAPAFGGQTSESGTKLGGQILKEAPINTASNHG